MTDVLVVRSTHFILALEDHLRLKILVFCNARTVLYQELRHVMITTTYQMMDALYVRLMLDGFVLVNHQCVQQILVVTD